MLVMHRQPDHVMTFLLAELGTSGSLDGQQRLVVKGRFAPKNFEGILRRYVKNPNNSFIRANYIRIAGRRATNCNYKISYADEYVICNGCKSTDTNFEKKDRLSFLICEKVHFTSYIFLSHVNLDAFIKKVKTLLKK
ncbi:putative translation initiation factor IF2/IF5 [Helianthus annuus]|nr:putative translation initiation factor IF2/IF5 [Helianthus annuus]KAJ0624229.1 putative translation initiation factor IF2/IF5 [Helianthus annuus]KAJ0784335.1 putative translation initiation factor IF2/IF5 [Helianthus annuus]KAJ0793540.1 putative translation initiation factor IF2/IF5 [Helianthus annuus]